MAVTLDDSQERLDVAKRDRQLFDNYWQSVADLCLPTRQFTRFHVTQGEQRNIQIYNETAPNAVESLASALHYLLTNPGERWFAIDLADFDEEADQEVEDWLYDSTSRSLAYLASPVSGFPTAAHEVYQDLAAFGSGACQADRSLGYASGMLKFCARALSGIWYLIDDLGNVTDVFRETEMRIRDIARTFGELPPALRTIGKSATGAEEKKRVVHHVYVRLDRNPAGVSAYDMAWGSRFFLLDGGRGATLDEGGFRRNPYITPRWARAADETYGRGPAMTVLPAIKMLNAMSRDQMIAGAMRTRPPVNVWDASLKGRKLDLSAGGVNWLTSSTRNPPTAMSTGADPSLADAMIERVEQHVERAFFLDTIELPIIRRSHSAMTAEEILARRQQALARSSPITSRINAEWCQPVVETTFLWMYETGRLLPAPASLRGKRLKVNFTSPMAQSQRQRETQNILEALQSAALLFQADPTILLNVNMDETLRTFWRQRNADPRVLRSRFEVEAMRQQQTQQALLPQQATAVRDLAAAGKDVSESIGLPVA